MANGVLEDSVVEVLRLLAMPHYIKVRAILVVGTGARREIVVVYADSRSTLVERVRWEHSQLTFMQHTWLKSGSGKVNPLD